LITDINVTNLHDEMSEGCCWQIVVHISVSPVGGEFCRLAHAAVVARAA
jgi:hypothetical protein